MSRSRASRSSRTCGSPVRTRVQPFHAGDEFGIGQRRRLDHTSRMWSAMRSVKASTASGRERVIQPQQVAPGECRPIGGHDRRAEHALVGEVQADRDDGDRGSRGLRRQHHARRAGLERHHPPGRMADPLGKEADRLAGGERSPDGGEHLGVLQRVHAGVLPSIDRNRAGPAHEEAVRRAREQRGLPQEPRQAPGRRDHDGRIEQPVRDGWPPGAAGRREGAVPGARPGRRARRRRARATRRLAVRRSGPNGARDGHADGGAGR